ncbi:Gfo/Idh/MocA family protein [Robiginitalea aurantiaca]|uniref:Gfo/Idh/MocA family oxidoreductase n=1 Tax=Robiginitalea aurantiaca TaxID=3056915 RepID=A0ABT7WG38_9FLAO|nr:Gfo/Idh/MocA family oxidoreductase [Robiginitalea aurantiaca]MDM9631882.1 Gfo/Idh/MocA family oxidoreductase [Robiginitalea aurantiaca]
MSTKIGWGIVGLGNIAGKFASDLARFPESELVAVASRDMAKANNFAKEFGSKKAFDSYRELFDDPQVHVVYIATPHSFHCAHTLAALEAGKHVLCEKPLGIDAGEVRQMTDLASKKGLFLMEALWSRFNPSIQEVYARVKAGDLGAIAYLRADFAFPALNRNPEDRLLNPALAGGSLLDIGIYPVFLAYLFLGVPAAIKVAAHFHHTGVEKQIAMIFDYGDAMAMLYSGFSSRSEMKAEISCEDGSAFLNPKWHQTESYRLEKGGEVHEESRPTEGFGYTYEIAEVHRCLGAGVLESPIWTWADSIALHTLLDKIRGLAGIDFPKP